MNVRSYEKRFHSIKKSIDDYVVISDNMAKNKSTFKL